ncbi:MAG: hypothetical protein ACI3T9_02335 [Romboutsia timonensis]
MKDIYSVEHYINTFNDRKKKFGDVEYPTLLGTIEALAQSGKCEAILNAIKAFDIVRNS